MFRKTLFTVLMLLLILFISACSPSQEDSVSLKETESVSLTQQVTSEQNTEETEEE